MRQFPLPQARGYVNLNTAAFDKAGILWFTGQNGVYGRVDPATGEVKVFEAPKGRGPYGIATTPDGSVYYASLAGSHIALCLDTGHVEYCAGDNRDIIGRHPDRIEYIHLKQVNPRVAAQAREERIGFYEAVQRGAMVEPPLGAPAMQPLLDDLAALNRDLRLVIEQDMYPAPGGSAKAIAARTRDYFTSLGLPPAED